MFSFLNIFRFKFKTYKISILTLFFISVFIYQISFCKTKEVKESGTKNVITKNTTEQQAYLGIIYIETSSGVQIAEVFPDSPASKAKLEPGDLILTANGYPVLGTYTLKEHIFSLKSGSEVILEVEKLSGKRVIVKAILEPMPENYKNILK